MGKLGKQWEDVTTTGQAGGRNHDNEADQGGDNNAKKSGKAPKVESPLVLAAKVKKEYQANVTQANFILHNIKNDPKWAQFAGVGAANLQVAIDTANKELDTSDFNKQYMMDQKGGLKKRMDGPTYEKSCQKFSLALQGPVNNLGKETKKIMMQYEAGLAAERE